MPRGQFLCTVARNDPLCLEHFRLALRIALFPPTDPGQFIQIFCRDPDWLDRSDDPRSQDPESHDPDLLHPLALLRRPFSLAGRRDLGDGSAELEIIHRVVGVGTQWMADLREGQPVSIIGPLGNRFALPDPSEDHTCLLVGGGVGIPPMLYLAERLARERHRAVAFSGAVTRDLLPLTVIGEPPSGDATPAPCIGEFARHDIPSVISTDDGSLGFTGFITQALESFLDRARDDDRFTLYTCGPELMMKRVAAIAADRGLEVQVAVERAMACGMGTCQSCCIRIKSDSPPHGGWRYALACTDGPIFRGVDLLW
jgi:dihydroorotate dehydrogenase electron transfer subunit